MAELPGGIEATTLQLGGSASLKCPSRRSCAAARLGVCGWRRWPPARRLLAMRTNVLHPAVGVGTGGADSYAAVGVVSLTGSRTVRSPKSATRSRRPPRASTYRAIDRQSV